jgi:RimJ/RimL family protein N-acetyltransferase
MTLELRPVTIANRGDLDDIDPGLIHKYWIHANWYWHQQSLDNPRVQFRLIHQAGVEQAVGMIAWGPYFADESLLEATPGDYEIYHLVIDQHHQGQRIGQLAVDAVLKDLLALPDCVRVLVAINPENEPSRRFFTRRGFRPFDRLNYDGDPMMMYAPD